MKYAGLVGIMLLLVLCTYEDIRKKKIWMWSFMLELPFLFVDIWVNTIMGSEVSVISRIAGLILGLLFIGISMLTKGQMGRGDGYLIGIIGVNLGFYVTLEMLTYSLMIAGILSIILLAFFHVSKKKAIPFVPFLSGGFLCCILLGGKLL